MGRVGERVLGLLQLLFDGPGEPRAWWPFLEAKGMCPNCHGLGRKLDVDLDKFLDKSKSLNDGSILFPEYAVDSWGWNLVINSGLFDPAKKLSKYTEKEMEALLHSKPMKVKTRFGAKDVNLTFEGIVARFTNKYIKGDVKTKSERTQKLVEPYMTMGPCPMCQGAMLSQETLKCKINGYNIADLTGMEIPELIEVVKGIKDPVAEPGRAHPSGPAPEAAEGCYEACKKGQVIAACPKSTSLGLN